MAEALSCVPPGWTEGYETFSYWPPPPGRGMIRIGKKLFAAGLSQSWRQQKSEVFL